MFRTLTALVMFSLVTPAVAAAASDPAVAAQKQVAKDVKHHAKDIDKLERHWEKAARKGDVEKLAELELEVNELARQELGRLRTLGVVKPEVSPNAHQPGKVLPPEHPQMASLRERLVELRQLSANPATDADELERTSRLLGSVSETVWDRADRAENRLDTLKASS